MLVICHLRAHLSKICDFFQKTITHIYPFIAQTIRETLSSLGDNPHVITQSFSFGISESIRSCIEFISDIMIGKLNGNWI